jgi:hypothetical protein
MGYSIDPEENRAAKTFPVPKENHLLQWGSSFGLWLLLENLDARLLQLKAISDCFAHLPTDRRHPHRKISLCIRQLLPNLGLHGYRDYPAIAIKLKVLPAISMALASGSSLILMVSSSFLVVPIGDF